MFGFLTRKQKDKKNQISSEAVQTSPETEVLAAAPASDTTQPAD